MLVNSPEESCHFLDFEGLKALGCCLRSIHCGPDLGRVAARWKRLDGRHGEIVDAHRRRLLRRGVAARMLDHIIEEARAGGLERFSLETGSGAAFEPALALYRRHTTDCAPFADYRPDPFSRFMTRAI